MPFTVSHAAAVLPIARLCGARLPLSALAIGSMAPDFGYFIHLGVPGALTHSLAGIIPHSVPAALAAWLLWHLLCSRPLLALLPQAAADRIGATLPRRSEVSIGWFLLLLTALALGALTHVAWDALTHADGALVARFAVLRTPLWPGARLYKVLQHLSSVFGLAVLAYGAHGWLRRTPPSAMAGPAVLGAAASSAVLCVIAAAGCCGALLGWDMHGASAGLERALFTAVVGAIKLMLAATLAFCLAWQLRALFARRARASK